MVSSEGRYPEDDTRYMPEYRRVIFAIITTERYHGTVILISPPREYLKQKIPHRPILTSYAEDVVSEKRGSISFFEK